MAGPHNNPGINRRALSRLFELVAERKDVEKSIVSVSVLEIYNENIRDLLASKVDDTVKYEIKTHPQDGQYVENLTSFPVQSLSDIDAYMAKAEKNRSSGRTNMNEHSSRSHMVLYVVVRTTNLQSGVVTVGKVSLVDLAGSERVGKSGATGDRMKEAQCINKSLSALGDVISSLSKNDSHIPYRNSKLTHLLKDSLGGNSKCLMFVNVSPASWNANETINSLQFAFRARGVVIGTAKKNVVPS
jgi:kinesin family protein C2/C3